LKEHSLPAAAEADLFGETQEQIRADEKQWDRQFAASREELRGMAREAAEEYRSGRIGNHDDYERLLRHG
jgi:hypothetical protein